MSAYARQVTLVANSDDSRSARAASSSWRLGVPRGRRHGWLVGPGGRKDRRRRRPTCRKHCRRRSDPRSGVLGHKQHLDIDHDFNFNVDVHNLDIEHVDQHLLIDHDVLIDVDHHGVNLVTDGDPSVRSVTHRHRDRHLDQLDAPRWTESSRGGVGDGR